MTAPRGPGPVATVHRLLIVAALVCAVFYGVWELRELRRTGDAVAGVLGGTALVVAGGIAAYLRSLRGLGAKLTPRD